MNDRQTKLQSQLLSFTSSEAFTWLVSNFSPDNGDDIGEALTLIAHRSWMKPEQVKLFDTYFSKSFPSGKRSLEIFSKIMSTKILAKKLESFTNSDLKNDSSKLGLARYRLGIFLEGISNVNDKNYFQPILDVMKEGSA